MAKSKRPPEFPVLKDAGDADAPIDMGGKISLTYTISVTREEFRAGGPMLMQNLIRKAALEARDHFYVEIKKRRWTFDF